MIKLRYIYLCLGLCVVSFEAGLFINKEKEGSREKRVVVIVDDPDCNYLRTENGNKRRKIKNY